MRKLVAIVLLAFVSQPLVLATCTYENWESGLCRFNCTEHNKEDQDLVTTRIGEELVSGRLGLVNEDHLIQLLDGDRFKSLDPEEKLCLSHPYGNRKKISPTPCNADSKKQKFALLPLGQIQQGKSCWCADFTNRLVQGKRCDGTDTCQLFQYVQRTLQIYDANTDTTWCAAIRHRQLRLSRCGDFSIHSESHLFGSTWSPAQMIVKDSCRQSIFKTVLPDRITREHFVNGKKQLVMSDYSGNRLCLYSRYTAKPGASLYFSNCERKQASAFKLINKNMIAYRYRYQARELCVGSDANGVLKYATCDAADVRQQWAFSETLRSRFGFEHLCVGVGKGLDYREAILVSCSRLAIIIPGKGNEEKMSDVSPLRLPARFSLEVSEKVDQSVTTTILPATTTTELVTITTVAATCPTTSQPTEAPYSTQKETVAHIVAEPCGENCLSQEQIYVVNQLGNPQAAVGDNEGKLTVSPYGSGFRDQTTKLLIAYKGDSVLYTKSNELYSANRTGVHRKISGPWDGSVANIQYSRRDDLLFIGTGSDLWRWAGDEKAAVHLRKNGAEVVFAYCEKDKRLLVVDATDAFTAGPGDSCLTSVASTFKETSSNSFLALSCSNNYVWGIDENDTLYRARGFNEPIEEVTDGVGSVSNCDGTDIVVLQRANANTASMYVSGTEVALYIHGVDGGRLASKSISCI